MGSPRPEAIAVVQKRDALAMTVGTDADCKETAGLKTCFEEEEWQFSHCPPCLLPLPQWVTLLQGAIGEEAALAFSQITLTVTGLANLLDRVL